MYTYIRDSDVKATLVKLCQKVRDEDLQVLFVCLYTYIYIYTHTTNPHTHSHTTYNIHRRSTSCYNSNRSSSEHRIKTTPKGTHSSKRHTKRSPTRYCASIKKSRAYVVNCSPTNMYSNRSLQVQYAHTHTHTYIYTHTHIYTHIYTLIHAPQ